jgi:hypothetical protein
MIEMSKNPVKEPPGDNLKESPGDRPKELPKDSPKELSEDKPKTQSTAEPAFNAHEKVPANWDFKMSEEGQLIATNTVTGRVMMTDKKSFNKMIRA